MHISKKRFLVFLMIFFMGCWSLAQIQSGAPIRDFRLPKFGENGRLQWDLSGKTGIYRSAERVDVEGVQLRVFSDEDQPREIYKMESKLASIFPEQGRAEGSGSVYGSAENFVISGESWEWTASDDRLVIESDVLVIFKQELSDLLN